MRETYESDSQETYGKYYFCHTVSRSQLFAVEATLLDKDENRQDEKEDGTKEKSQEELQKQIKDFFEKYEKEKNKKDDNVKNHQDKEISPQPAPKPRRLSASEKIELVSLKTEKEKLEKTLINVNEMNPAMVGFWTFFFGCVFAAGILVVGIATEVDSLVWFGVFIFVMGILLSWPSGKWSARDKKNMKKQLATKIDDLEKKIDDLEKRL